DGDLEAFALRYSTVQKQIKALQEEASLENFINLAFSFMVAGLYTQAEKLLDKAESVCGKSAGIEYSRADLQINKGNTDKGMQIYESLCLNQSLDPSFRAQIYLQIGEIWLFRRADDKALDCFNRALELDPLQGDARLQRARINSAKREFHGLEEDLQNLQAPGINWVFPRNQESAPELIAALSRNLKN
ncbi:MAG: hypothetical protein K2X27_06375, partial [Candidatus Obscuribacterales bacterium]|nr:hypothetical protein [Candidatus Obscuribacterales bacterium]